MRIAHVANFYGPTSGGLRTTMHHLGTGYVGAGHDYLMVVPGKEDSDERTPFGRRITVSAPKLPRSGGYRVILKPSRVREILDEWAPDRLEISDRTTLRGLGAWARTNDVPTVFFAHERADGIIRSQVSPWLHWAVPITRLADRENRATARAFDTIVCTTAYAAQEFERIGVETVSIPLGVDLKNFGPELHDAQVRATLASPNEILIVMASRLSKEKSPELAVDAARLLAAQGHRVRLVSAGTGAIAEKIEHRAVGAPVTFLGFISDRQHYSQILAAADVIVAPGPVETFGLAALEGLASGTPVVVNANSALPEVVGDAGLSAASTPEAFAEAVLEILARPEGDRRHAARTRAEKFPWDRTVKETLTLHGAE